MHVKNCKNDQAKNQHFYSQLKDTANMSSPNKGYLISLLLTF